MSSLLARFVSYLFHPLLITTYLFMLLAYALPSALLPFPVAQHLPVIGLLFMMTFVLPVISLGIFKIFGMIRSYHLEDRRERILPFTMISLIYVSTTYMFYTKHVYFTDNFFKLLVIIDLLVVIATLATFFFKVSVHSIAIWGIIGIILPLNKVTEINSLFYPTVISILLAGIIMSSRLKLDAHNPREVIIGGALGLAASIAGMFVLFTN